MRLVTVGTAVVAIALAVVTAAQQPAQPGALRIVVIEGEDAVNIIQQKTAVRPIVEVRDSNNLPVAGVAVRFTIQGSACGGGASFANTQSVATVTTNAAGRAVAPDLQAVGRGAFRIDVQADFQGRAATATINQTNYPTAADVPAAPSNAISTVGIAAGIGAAAIGGTLAVKQVTDANCNGSENEALDSLELARQACSPRTSGCEAAAQNAAALLGDWCSCDGRANVDTTLRGAQGLGLDQLSAAGVLVSVTLPGSCQ